MKHKYISKKFWETENTPMGALGERAARFDDVIKLSLGDTDLITDTAIIESAFKDAKAGHTKYTAFSGDPELIDAIVKFYKQEYDMDIANNEVFVTAGGCVAMYLALKTILNDGDEVLLLAPYFTPYKRQVELAGGIAVEVPTYEEEDFQVEASRLENAINDKTRAIIINTPCNPTGNCLTVETMREIGKIAERHDLLVICDDIYTAFSYQNPFVPFASLPGMKERSIIINSVSKNYTMTGWRIGNIIAPDFIIETIQMINENMVFTAPSVSQRASIYAYTHRADFQAAMVKEYRERVYYAAERVNALANMHVIYPPKGTFYLFVNIKDTGMTSQEVADLILQEAHVLTVPGNAFGDAGEGFLRLACTISKEEISQAFDRIAKIDIFNPGK